jgi:uncharacterized iron-regulated protein
MPLFSRALGSLALLLFVFAPAPLRAQQPDAATTPAASPVTCQEGFALFDGNGGALGFAELIARAKQADAVFLGENHDDRRGHCLQFRLLQELHAAVAPRPVVLALEMFERDTQVVLDEYLGGLIDERQFLAAARPWPNYKDDYRPLVEFSRQKGMRVVASNAPRRYVTLTARRGAAALEALAPEAKAWLPPLPLAPASAAYRQSFGNVMQNLNPAGPCADASELAKGAQKPDPHKPAAHSSSHGGGAAAMPSWDNLIASQSLWDAAMAHAVADSLRRHPGALVVHLNGGFHTEGGLGLLERLATYRPGTRTFVVGIYPRREFPAFDDDLRGVADSIVVTDCAAYRKKP